MYSINITEPAEQDITKAVRYIATQLQNKTAAQKLLSDTIDAVYSLEEMPFRQPLVSEETLARLGIRFLPVNNYLLFYVVREELKTVVIERFLHGKRNWAAILSALNS